jgi:heavy metal sensor kinase
MFSKKRISWPRTLALRLTFWYGTIVVLVSGVAFFLFYLLVTGLLEERADRELLNQVSTFESILKAKGVDAVKRVMVLESQAAGERKIFFRLLSLDGSAFSSSNMSYWENIGVAKHAIRALIEGRHHVFDTLMSPDRKHRVRILYRVIGPGIILQLGQSMEHASRFIEAFRKIFVGTMSGLAALAILIGWFMARKALGGVGEVTRTAMEITGGELGRRVPVKNWGDEIERLAVTFNQMLDRIEALVAGIKEMSDNIAHDLKSPVTRIRGMAEVTLTTAGPGADAVDQYQGMAAGVIEECDGLLEMINAMLMISRTEAGVGAIERADVDISALVRGACELFAPVAEDKGVALACRAPEGCTAAGDRHLLQRAVGNLLDNAVKYTPGGGCVDVFVCGIGGRWLEVVVEDTGIGIEASDLPRIFDRFYRCDFSRTLPGTGLGLSLVQSIARAHGGSVSVKSAPGEGSAFHLALPVSRDALKDDAGMPRRGGST